MRKLWLVASIVGLGLLGVALLLKVAGSSNSWIWVAGAVGLALGSAAFALSRRSTVAPVVSAPRSRSGSDIPKVLDDFEQRFAELKRKKPGAAVLKDLYDLGTRLEQNGRITQATAVYRHLAHSDATYRDVSSKLQRLDADRAKSKTAAPAAAVPAPRSTAPAQAIPDGQEAQQHLGRYHLEREIGRGAMGIVYLGRDTAINRLVAIKAIPLASEFSDAELIEARSRFFREAETAGRLNHPNIVTIYDVGEERGLAYIAMEYLKGRHLSSYATSGTLLEPGKVLELVARTAEALGFAHKQHVVHRDIKPANLMFDPGTDVLKITDFGIARLSGAGTTRTGIVLGTPSFMSPEQLEGRTVTGHSDLFSLGVSLYQLLTGHLPFTADSMTGLMQRIAETPHPPLRVYRPDLPACVEGVIDRALAKTPEARFDSGAQMAAALNDCRARASSSAP